MAAMVTRALRRIAPVLAIPLTLTLGLQITGSAAARGRLAHATGAQSLPGTGCPAFPVDNVWNTPITHLPVNPHSRQWLKHMAAGSTYLHPDYGPGGGSSPYGIPWQITAR
ncbi:MAG TPA: hypothetical protein VE983_13325, partial [Solirubrobacteraceae bacterium]|nr:hypothetical protein [Solirubrobacteraceae bacterium]